MEKIQEILKLSPLGDFLKDYYSGVEYPKKKTSPGYLAKLLKEKDVPFNKKEIESLFSELEKAGVGYQTSGSFYHKKFIWKDDPRKLLFTSGNGTGETVAQGAQADNTADLSTLVSPPFSITFTVTVNTKETLSKAIDIMDLLR